MKSLILGVLRANMKSVGLLLVLVLLCANGALAANTCTWSASAAGNWNVATNWTSCGSTIPQNGDSVVFSSTSTQNCTINVSTNSLNSLTIQSTYTGTISQGSGDTVTITGSTGFSQAGGTFTGSAAAISTTALSLTGGTFTSTSGTLTVTGNFTHSGGTFSANGGTVAFNDTGATSITDSVATTFNNVSFGGSSTASIPDGLTATGTITLSSGTVSLAVNQTFSYGTFNQTGGTYTASSGTNFTGGTVTISGGSFALSSASGSTMTVTGSVTLSNSAAFTSGTSGITINVSGAFNLQNTATFTGGSSTFSMTVNSLSLQGTSSFTGSSGAGTLTVSGAMNLSGGTFAPNAGAADINGTLTLASGSISGGTTTANGNVTSSGNVTGTGAITFGGTNQTFNPGGFTIPSGTITIATTGAPNTVTLAGALVLGTTQAFVVSAGTFSQGANTINGGAFSVTGGTFTGGSAAITAASVSVTSGTFTSTTGTLTLTGAISVSDGSFNGSSSTISTGTVSLTGGTLTSTSGTLTVTGASFTNNGGTFTNNSGTVTFTGASPNLSLPTATTFNNVNFSGSGTATIPNGLTAAGNVNLNSGTLNQASGQTLQYSGTFTVASGASYTNTAGSATVTGNSPGGALSLNGSFSFGGSAHITATGLTVSSTGSFSGGSGGSEVIQVNGSANSSGTVTLGTSSSNSLTVTGSITISGGTFTGSAGASSSISVTGGINVSAGQFTTGCTESLSAGLMTLNGGIFESCNSSSAVETLSLSLAGIALSNGSTFDYVGSSTITLSGPVTNSSGTLRMWGTTSRSSGAPSCTNSTYPATLTSSSTESWSGSAPATNYTLVGLKVTNQSATSPLTLTCNDCQNVSGNTNWNFTTTCPSPTLVTFNSLTAAPCDGGVLIEWKTGFESDNLGYHVYREDGGTRTRLNPSLIAGTALLAGPNTILRAGNSHSWLDPQGTSSSRYLVEEVSLKGIKTEHGPAYVNPYGGISPTAQRMLAANAYSSHPLLGQLGRSAANNPSFAPRRLQARVIPAQTTAGQVNKQYQLAAGQAVLLGVTQEGWYHVTASQLEAAGLPSGVNPATLQLFLNAQEQAIEVEETGGQMTAIDFYGVGLNSVFSGTNVYWLVWGEANGTRVASTKRKGSGASLTSFQATLEWQPRTSYFAALLNGDGNSFFGPALDADDPVSQPLNAPNLATGTAGSSSLQVTMQGITAGPHLVAVSLNGTQVGTLSFNDQANYTSTFTVPNTLLAAGANTLGLTAQGGANDVTFVDTVLLTYPNTYTAAADTLNFTAPAGAPVTIGGFDNNQILVIDITDPTHPESVQGTITAQGSGFEISFSPPGTGTRTMLALTTEQEGQPVSIAANNPSTWHKAQAGADVVFISNAAFISSLGPLQSWRQSQDHTVAVIDVQQAYNEFNFGAQSPYAIRSLLSTANTNWKLKPHWVLLVGDGTLDPLNYLGTGLIDWVPVEQVDTTLLKTADDDWYADFNNTGVPVMAIGRLPVTSTAEASALVNKIISYEQAGPQPWKNNVLLVAGASDSGDPFDTYTADVQALLPASQTVQTILEDQDGNARNDLLAALNTGQGLVNYAGHGSTEVWSTDGLLSDSDATAMTNGSNTPFILDMTCLNGFFQDVYTFALAKAFILAPGGGAVGVWASSALTNSAPQATLDQAMVSALFGTQSLTIGDAARTAKTAVTDPDVLHSWILFGDPAMKLH